MAITPDPIVESDGRTRKLLAGKYAIVTSGEPLFAGTILWAEQVKADLRSGVYDDGDIIMHIESGKLYRVRETSILMVEKLGPDDLTSAQRRMANRLRKTAWPESGHRKGIGSARARGRSPDDI